MQEKNVASGDTVPRGYVRRKEAAKYLGISERTLTEWQRSRLVPHIPVSHKVTLFKIKELERALDRLTVRAVKADV